MNDRATSPPPDTAATNKSWPTYALRSWLTALLTQTLQIETQMKYRIEDLETEAARLRAQLDRAAPVIEALKQSIIQVDDRLRRQRDADLIAAATDTAPSPPQKAADSASRPRSETPDQETQATPAKPEPPGRSRHKGK
jgi:hypothetical protein